MEERDERAVAFREAVFAGDVDRLRTLFTEHPGLSEVIDEPWFHFGKPAIVQAAGARDRRLADALLDLGADIEARSAWENGPYSALHSLVDGADAKSLALAEHFVTRGAEIDVHAAAGMGRADVIESILAQEPDRVSEPGPDGATPLHLAKDVEIAALLLDHGAEIDKRCVDHRSTPAMWAAQARLDVLRFLVENGATPDLFMAVLLEDEALAEQLLADDPEAIEVVVKFGRSHPHLGGGDKYVWALDGADTPLELARRRGAVAIHRFLYDRSPPRVRLVAAARSGDVEELQRLLQEPPPSDGDDSGQGSLLATLEPWRMRDALCGSAAAARTLLAHGADPNVREEGGGATSLHHAAWTGDVALARALLDGGADPTLKDRAHDATPLGWAEYNRQEAVTRLLRETLDDRSTTEGDH